jgi:hypothetical protein
MRVVAHKLGAIELIELGRSRNTSAQTLRRPFLSNRKTPEITPLHMLGASLQPSQLLGPQLGGLDFATIGSFLAGAFSALFSVLGDLISVPLDLMSKGVGLLFDGLAGLLVNVPILGVFASQILILTKTMIQWGLSLPGLLLSGIGNVFGEIKKAIDATRSANEKKSDEAEAKNKILTAAEKKGGAALKSAVSDAISGKSPEGVSGVPEKNPNMPDGADEVGGSSKTGLEQALSIGLPVAGAATLVFLAIS